MAFVSQYAFRAQKSTGLVSGAPSYSAVDGFEAPSVPTRTFTYSPDGRLFAIALPDKVQIFQAENAHLLQDLPLPNVVEIAFSPRGTYLSTWERPQKLGEGEQHKNHRIFSASTGEQLLALTQKSQDGWDVQYTITESHAIRLVGQEVQVYSPVDWARGVIDKIRVEGASQAVLSPGLNPSLAVFIPEKKGQPASVRVYSLLTPGSPPSSQKTFFKAEKATIKWNALGTQVLVLTHTDVDATNKSYYGQTGLYLLSAAGNFDCRVQLDKEGPVHDFAWAPGSKEFGVVYGYMPAKAMLFDSRVRSVHDFGTGFYNYLSFNPQGRLIALAGFGNLAGEMNIFDRRSLTRVATIDAANTSHCEWSPDGRTLLTATLSPRLRVDNGIKLWHALGALLHVQMIEELYQTSWRPTPVDSAPGFPNAIPQPPAPSQDATDYLAQAKAVPVKAKTAYRPPGARGTTASLAYARDDGTSGPPSGANTPRSPRSPAPGSGGRRFVPGAAHSPSPGPGPEKDKKKRREKPTRASANPNGGANGSANGNGKAPVKEVEVVQAEIEPVADPALDPVAKKLRNLNKKLKAIDELKEKQGRGERLEATQLKKIESEAEIRKELAAMNGA
ncbi:translation initiation factor eIF-2A [Peniophora sp. CONT]|nr:translation initiation factor eIF-2A [Peniophora sp. CONT]